MHGFIPEKYGLRNQRDERWFDFLMNGDEDGYVQIGP